jgi:hypothetical protein
MRRGKATVGLLAAGIVGCQILVGEVDTDVDAGLGIAGEGGMIAEDGGTTGGDGSFVNGHHDAASTRDAKGGHDARRADSDVDAHGPATPDGNPGLADTGLADHGVIDAPIPPAGDGCSHNVEDCTNGIDDNCNGLVDCADPECTGDGGDFSCTALPDVSGWTIVAYDSNGDQACPSYYSSTGSTVVVSASASPDSCTCNCANTAPATCQGAWAWTTNGTSPSCGTAPSSGGNGIDNGQCQNSNGTDPLNPTYYFIGAPNNVHTQAGSCSASGAVTSKPAANVVHGETCALPQAGAGCSTGGVCAPKVTSGFSRCSVMSGSATCPTGFVQSAVYTTSTDTRTCSGCACGTVDLACNVTGMYFFSNTGCNGGNYTMTESCTDVSSSTLADYGGNSNSFQAVVSNNGQAGTCSVTSNSTAQGSVGPDTSTTVTVCCEP